MSTRVADASAVTQLEIKFLVDKYNCKDLKNTIRIIPVNLYWNATRGHNKRAIQNQIYNGYGFNRDGLLTRVKLYYLLEKIIK